MYINGYSKNANQINLPVKYAIDYNEQANIAKLSPFTKLSDLGSGINNLIFHRNDAFEIKDIIKRNNTQCLFTNTNKINFFRSLNRKIRLMKVVIDEQQKVILQEENK